MTVQSGRLRRTGSAAPAAGRRHRPDLRVEKELLSGPCTRLAAMDEVGRGALAGPVTVGVVVVTGQVGRVPQGLRDSKLLTPTERAALVAPVVRWVAEWAIGHADPAEIDRFGIIFGLRTAALRALGALLQPVDAVLLDGNHNFLRAPTQGAPFESCVTGGSGLEAEPGSDPGDGPADAPPDDPVDGPPGDGVSALTPVIDDFFLPVHLRVKADLRCAAVAAASVLAKTTRDAIMIREAERFPAYGWEANKGYATPAHLAAIAQYGSCEMHRRSWRLPDPLGPTAVGDDEDVAPAEGWAPSVRDQRGKGA